MHPRNVYKCTIPFGAFAYCSKAFRVVNHLAPGFLGFECRPPRLGKIADGVFVCINGGTCTRSCVYTLAASAKLRQAVFYDFDIS